MQKRNLIILSLLSLSLISFVSAYSYYGRFSVGDFLNEIEPSTLILPLLFIIFFTLINFSLSKVFKGNKAVSGVAAFSVALLLVYWINRMNIDVESFFYTLGISSDVLLIIIPLFLIGGAIYLRSKFGLSTTMIVFGVLFLLGSLTGIVYETGILAVLGIILLIIGLIMKKGTVKKLINK
jgi:hypothetical protein